MKLFVVVEGQSEERFVREILRPHVPHLDPVAILVEMGRTPDDRPARGGADWAKWSADIRKTLGKGPHRFVTTMFDLYGLPSNFPARDTRDQYDDSASFADALEQAMAREVTGSRFLPNLVVHEFETLVLASLPQLNDQLPQPLRKLLDPLRKVVAEKGAEGVNCGKTTSPSQRLADAGISFGKLAHGVPAVQRTGIPKLKGACPRFKRWITKLENL